MKTRYAYAIGDLHGRFDLLLESIKLIEVDAKQRGITNDYTMITLGDYTDRGPNTKGIIDYLIAHPEIQSIAGNHEYMLLDCFDWKTLKPLPYPKNSRDLMSFLRNGGIETLESYGFSWETNSLADVDLSVIPIEHLRWMKNLPIKIETENHFFVHAGVKPYVPLDEQDPNDMMWIRYFFMQEADAENPYDWGKHIVHGHTPHQSCRAELKHNRTNLDTGSVWTDRQAIGLFDLTQNRGPIDVMYAETIPMIMQEEDYKDYEDDEYLEKLYGKRGIGR